MSKDLPVNRLRSEIAEHYMSSLNNIFPFYPPYTLNAFVDDCSFPQCHDKSIKM